MIQYDVRAQNIHPKILQLHKTMEESVERVPMPEVQFKSAMMLDAVAVTNDTLSGTPCLCLLSYPIIQRLHS